MPLAARAVLARATADRLPACLQCLGHCSTLPGALVGPLSRAGGCACCPPVAVATHRPKASWRAARLQRAVDSAKTATQRESIHEGPPLANARWPPHATPTANLQCPCELPQPTSSQTCRRGSTHRVVVTRAPATTGILTTCEARPACERQGAPGGVRVAPTSELAQAEPSYPLLPLLLPPE